jgi:hypothetical protein
MNCLKLLALVVFLCSMSGCTGVMNVLAKDDPCWKAGMERKKLKRETDDFERRMIQLRIDAYEQNCHDDQIKKHDEWERTPR